MVANYGYLPGKVNFSCRIARCARDRDPPVNIIESLNAVADLDTTDLVQRLGSSFARGHKEASGGIVNTAEFEELCLLMKVGEKPDKPEGETPKKKAEKSPQKNTLNNYFKKSWPNQASPHRVPVLYRFRYSGGSKTNKEKYPQRNTLAVVQMLSRFRSPSLFLEYETMPLCRINKLHSIHTPTLHSLPQCLLHVDQPTISICLRVDPSKNVWLSTQRT